MQLCRFVPVILLAGGWAFGAEQAPATDPWRDHFVMRLRDQDRSFASWQDTSWLIITANELSDVDFLADKDVSLVAKLLRCEGRRAWFYRLPNVEVVGDPELWQTRVDGDNLYLFGHLSRIETGLRLTVSAVASAPADQQIINERLKTVPATDWDGRLTVANWVRDQANNQGNREFWLASADSIASAIIDEITAAGNSKKDVKLILRAMSLATDVLHDTARAARIGSEPWIRQTPGTEDIALRMRKLDYEFVDGRWLPRSAAVTAEFEARFKAIPWTNANDFYQLGLWCDANSDLLPSSREKSYRCFQAGLKADPQHNGIRRELGLDLVSKNDIGSKPQGDFLDIVTGFKLTSPKDWQRSEPIEGDATWVDPHSETAFITAKLLRSDPHTPFDFTTAWTAQLTITQARSGFTNLLEETLEVARGSQARHLRYSYKEGRFTRFGDVILIGAAGAALSVRLDASYSENEQAEVWKRCLDLAKTTNLPAAIKTGASAQSPSNTPPTPPAD